VHFIGSQIIKILTPKVQVLDYCQVTRFSKELEDSAQSEPPAAWDPPAQEHLQRRRKEAWERLPRIFVEDGSDNFHGNSGRVGWQQVCWTCYPDSITKIRSMLSCVHLHQIMNASLTCSVEYVYHHAHTRTTHTHRMVSCVVNDTKVWINH